MTINGSADCSVDSSAINRLRDDDISSIKNMEKKAYEQQQPPATRREEEENRFLTNVENSKITILPEKYKSSSKTRLPQDESNDSKINKNNDSDENSEVDEHLPPDGGVRAWMIMLGSFMINGILFSVINTYSLIYVELQKRLEESGETEASSKAALVGSLTIGTTFFLSPVAGILTDKFGIQLTTFLGGAFAFGGMLLASLFSHKVEILYLTYGVMYGFGASLAYTPSLVILGHYFKRYLGLVNGIVTAGSSVFTIIMPYIIEPLLKHFGLVGTLRSLAVLTSVVMACAVLFKPVPLKKAPEIRQTAEENKVDFCSKLKEVFNVSIWKKKKYVVWASAIPLALFGYFVPYVHIGKFVAITFTDADRKLPVMCIGITSGIGRLVFGYIADLPRVNRILLQQISFVSIGILTMLLPVTPTFGLLLVIALCMGLFDGCFISLLGPIAFDICGQKGATQAIGFLLGMCSVPLTVGPPIAGRLFDLTGSYKLPFILAGLPPIVGALAMFLVRCVKDEKKENEDLQGNLQNGDDDVDERIKSSVMETGVSVQEEGRLGKKRLRCRLLDAPARVSSRNYRQSYSPCTKYDRSRFFKRVEEFTKVHGSRDNSESAPLLIGLNGRPEFTRTYNFNRSPPSSLLLTY